MEELRSTKLFVDIFYRFVVGAAIRLGSRGDLIELNLGPSISQFQGSITASSSTPSIQSGSQPAAVPAYSQSGPGSFQSTTAESERFLQAAYNAQQQQLRLHQQQLKQRAVTYPSTLGQLQDPGTGQTFPLDFGMLSGGTGYGHRIAGKGSAEHELSGLSMTQRAFDFDPSSQDFSGREAARLLDRTGQRQVTSQSDRKYGHFLSASQQSQIQSQGAQATPSATHEVGKSSPSLAQLQQTESMMSSYAFTRSASGTQSSSRSQQQQLQQQQQQLQQSSHLSPSARQHHSSQLQLQQQHAMFATSRGLSGSSLANPGPALNPSRSRTRDNSTQRAQSQQQMSMSQHMQHTHHGLLSGVPDYDYEDTHIGPSYHGTNSTSPIHASRSTSNISLPGDYPDPFGSYGGAANAGATGSTSRGYDIGDISLGLESEEYTVGNASRRPSYTMHSSSRVSDNSLQSQHESDFDSYEAQMLSLRLNSPRHGLSEQQSFHSHLAGGVAGQGSVSGTGQGILPESQLAGRSPLLFHPQSSNIDSTNNP